MVWFNCHHSCLFTCYTVGPEFDYKLCQNHNIHVTQLNSTFAFPWILCKIGKSKIAFWLLSVFSIYISIFVFFCVPSMDVYKHKRVFVCGLLLFACCHCVKVCWTFTVVSVVVAAFQQWIAWGRQFSIENPPFFPFFLFIFILFLCVCVKWRKLFQIKH